MSTYHLTGSIVLYDNDRDTLQQVIACFFNTSLSVRLFVVDNSPTDTLRSLFTDPRCEYTYSEKNLGFGKAHNVSLKKILTLSTYHLVLNPDVLFGKNTFEQLIRHLERDPMIGLAIPKVMDMHSRMQYVCRRLPSPSVLIIRRMNIKWLNRLFSRQLNFYEMKDMNYLEPFETISVSGCFMFFRTTTLKEIGFFDERFFLYMEDVDLCRRVAQRFKVFYYPEIEIRHRHARQSYGLNRFFIFHIISAIKYFNKWGWFFDKAQMAKTVRNN